MGKWHVESGAAGSALIRPNGEHVGLYEAAECITQLEAEVERLKDLIERMVLSNEGVAKESE